MKTKVIKTIEKEEWGYTCDFCGFNTSNNKGCCGTAPIMECGVCGRDFCKDCGTVHFSAYSDYPEFKYCWSCNAVYIEFLPFLEKLDEEYERNVEELQKKWVDIALDKAERQKNVQNT